MVSRLFLQRIRFANAGWPGTQINLSEAVDQRTQRFSNLIPVGGAQFHHALAKAEVEVDPHNLPVKGFDWPEARALRTSVLTAL